MGDCESVEGVFPMFFCLLFFFLFCYLEKALLYFLAVCRLSFFPVFSLSSSLPIYSLANRKWCFDGLMGFLGEWGGGWAG